MFPLLLKNRKNFFYQARAKCQLVLAYGAIITHGAVIKENPSKGIVQQILRRVETRLIPFMLVNWRPAHFYFILKGLHNKRSKLRNNHILIDLIKLPLNVYPIFT